MLISIFDNAQPMKVKLYLQDTPHRGSTIFLTVKMEPEDLLNRHSEGKQYVYLVAKSDDGHFQFLKEAKILLSYQDRMVYNHTNKSLVSNSYVTYFLYLLWENRAVGFRNQGFFYGVG